LSGRTTTTTKKPAAAVVTSLTSAAAAAAQLAADELGTAAADNRRQQQLQAAAIAAQRLRSGGGGGGGQNATLNSGRSSTAGRQLPFDNNLAIQVLHIVYWGLCVILRNSCTLSSTFRVVRSRFRDNFLSRNFVTTLLCARMALLQKTFLTKKLMVHVKVTMPLFNFQKASADQSVKVSADQPVFPNTGTVK
jgi:hypothetical protein